MVESCRQCVELVALRHEVAELRRLLGLAGKASDVMALRRAFGLTEAEARLLCALCDAAGDIVPSYTLAQIAVRDEALLEGSDALKTHVCRVRRKLGGGAIETVSGVGYRLTHEGRSLCASAVRIGNAA